MVKDTHMETECPIDTKAAFILPGRDADYPPAH